MNVPEELSPEAVQVLLNDLKAFQQEQREDATNHLPPYHCGLIQAQLGDHAAAVQSYQVAIDRNPEFSPAHFNMALAYSAQDSFASAEQAYRQAAHHNPDDAEPWANLGALYEFHDKPGQALDCFRKAVELDPDEGAARRRIGNILFARGELEEAKQVFQAAVERNGEDAEAWNSLGLMEFHLKHNEEALKHYERAVQLNDGLSQAWNNLGNLHLELGSEAAAVGAYRKALAGGPDDPTVWFNLGEFFFKRDHPEAEKCLARVVELQRDDMEAWELLRQWYARHPDYPGWKSVLRVLLGHRPDDLALMRELAHVHEQGGEPDEAIRVLKDVIALDPEDTTSRLAMTSLALKSGSPMDAFRQMSEMDSAVPEVLQMWHYLGQRLLYQGHLEEAETAFMRVIANLPGHADAWQFLAEMAFGRELWELAFERYQRASAINRNDKSIWLPLAGHFSGQGRHEKAAACLDQLAGHLRYLPEDWEAFLPTYQRAGRGEAFLEGLAAMIREKRLANHLWADLAELWLESGRPEKAREALENVALALNRIPGAEELRERIELDLEEGGARAGRPARTPPPPPPPPPKPKEEKTALGRGAPKPAAGAAGTDAARARPVSQAARLREQLAEARRRVEADSGDFQAWFRGGSLLFRLGELKEAEVFFRGALKLDPEEAKVWYNLGCVQEAQHQPKAALASFRKAVERDATFAQAWNWVGVLHFHGNHIDDARQAYVRSLAHDRSSAKTWHNLGVLYLGQGAEEKSAYCFGEVEKLGGLATGAGLVAHPGPAGGVPAEGQGSPR